MENKQGAIIVRMLKMFLIPVLALGLAGMASAHGPTRQKVMESITINADPAKVWALVGDFNSLPKWHPSIEKSVDTDGNNVGSMRTLTVKGGGEVVEALEDYSAPDMTLRYRMKSGVLPVTNYTSMLKVAKGEAPGTSVVEWRGAFYRGFPGNDPPPNLNDDAAVEAITNVYKTGLAQLKKVLEQ
jgi:uncharacterized protein YndB with AHSA1/START domain